MSPKAVDSLAAPQHGLHLFVLHPHLSPGDGPGAAEKHGIPTCHWYSWRGSQSILL